MGTAANGFLKTGIYLLNKDIFADYEFIITDEENNDLSTLLSQPKVIHKKNGLPMMSLLLRQQCMMR